MSEFIAANPTVNQAVNVYEVRFTNPDEFIDEVRKDLATGAIQDNVIRLAHRKAHAIMSDIEPDRPWDRRPAVLWRTHYVEASYISTRHQLVKLSAFCGVIQESPAPGNVITPANLERSQDTEKELLRTVRKVQQAIAKETDLDVRGGGIFVEDGIWTATPGTEIEAPAEVNCATCGTKLHWANDAWRDQWSRIQTTVTREGRFGPTQAVDHVHDPDEKGRMV